MDRSTELFVWNRRALSIGGMWPLDSTFVHFYISYIYYMVHITLAYTDFYSAFGDAQLMMENLLETSIQTMCCIKMILFRHSGTLRKVLRRIEENTNENNYQDETERQLYLAYNSIGRSWFRGLHYSAFITTFIYYAGPFKDFVIAAINNDTLPYVLPFKTHLFFDIQDVRVYAFMYVWQLPIVYCHYCHTATVCFIFTMIVYVSGEIAVLAHRIRHVVSPFGSSDDDNMELAFHNIIKKHLQVVWQASAIDDVLNLVLLEELLISTVLFGFVVFNFLSSTGALYEKLFFANYCVALLGLILVYCITGDFIIRASVNLHEAYYECLWYEMKTKYQKNLIICLARSQLPLQLTAGRFYVFSLPRFSEILKTSMAYVTMLRTVM